MRWRERARARGEFFIELILKRSAKVVKFDNSDDGIRDTIVKAQAPVMLLGYKALVKYLSRLSIELLVAYIYWKYVIGVKQKGVDRLYNS